MVKRLIFLLFVVLFLISFTSAEYGINKITTGVKVTTTTTTYVTGSNINASTINSTCTGTDKVSSINYSNFTGKFGITCSTDATAAGGSTKKADDIYLYNDTLTIYFNKTLAGTNLSVNASDYWDGLGTYNTTALEEQSGGILGIDFSWLESFIDAFAFITWDKVINGTMAFNSSLSLNYFNYTNNTLLSQFENDLSTTEPFWNANLTAHNDTWTSIFNLTYQDAWLYTTNGTFALNDTLILNYFNYTNKTLLSEFENDLSTTEPFWNANLTAHNDTWNSGMNQTYEDAWQYVINSTFYNTTTPPRLDEIGNPLNNKTFTMANKILAFRYTAPTPAGDFDGAFEVDAAGGFTGDLVHIHQHSGNPSDVTLLHLEAEDPDVLPFIIEGIGTYIANFTGGNLWVRDNITTTKFFVGDGRYLTNLPAGTEADPFWSANLTANNASWNSDLWNTTDEIWAVVYNGTFALNDTLVLNYFNYTNKTLLSEFENDLSTTEPFWNANLTAHNDSWNTVFNQTYEDAWQYTINSTFAQLGEPFWSANLTANNVTWNSIFNQTYHDGWLYVTNNTFLLTTNQTLVGNYSATIDFCLGDGSICLSNSAGASETDPFWSANLTANNDTWNLITNQTYEDAWKYTTNDTFRLIDNHTFMGEVNFTGDVNISSGNLTIPQTNKICLDGDVCSQWILANSSGVYIQG